MPCNVFSWKTKRIAEQSTFWTVEFVNASGQSTNFSKYSTLPACQRISIFTRSGLEIISRAIVVKQ